MGVMLESLRPHFAEKGIDLREIGGQTVWPVTGANGELCGWEFFIGLTGAETSAHDEWVPIRLKGDSGEADRMRIAQDIAVKVGYAMKVLA